MDAGPGLCDPCGMRTLGTGVHNDVVIKVALATPRWSRNEAPWRLVMYADPVLA